jgi:hypothetical protein
MGYKPGKAKATRITYSDFEGLEVYAVAPPMGELMDIADQRLNLNAAADQRMRVFEVFSKYIRSWNVEHPEPANTKPDPNRSDDAEVCARCGLAEDMPVPTTAEYMMCLDIDFIMPVFFGWLTTMSRVDPTKFLPSNNGGNNSQQMDLMRMLAQQQSPMPSNVQNLNLG